MAATGPEAPGFTPYSAPTSATPDGASATMQAFAAGFFESAGAAMTTVLNRPVTVRVVEVATLPGAAVVADGDLPCLVTEIAYQRGLKGTHFLVIAREGANAFADALSGGESSDIGPAQLEAIRDTVNQILVSAGPALMPLFGRSVSFGAASVQFIEDREALPGEITGASGDIWVARVHVADEEGLDFDAMLTISRDLAHEIAALGGAETPAPAAAPVAAAPDPGTPSKIEMILDVTLPVTVELGRARMQIQEVLKLGPGSVIELDKSAGDPVDLYINDRPIAKGEVVIIDENFGVRLTSIVTTTERIKTLR